MNNERISDLIKILEAVPEPRFSIDSIFYLPERGRSIRNVTKEDMIHDCGSTACALGYAALSTKFNAQGLRTERTRVTYCGKYGHEAAADFFGIDRYIAELIFRFVDPSVYSSAPQFYPESMKDITTRHVINKLRELLVMGEDEFKKAYKIVPYMQG